MEYILQTEDLTKRYGAKTVLDNVNMNIKKGDIYGFIGRNGAGKTTLMRIILSLANATKGKYTLFEGLNHREAGKRMGSLIEAPGLYRDCTALENLKRFAILSGIKNPDYKGILEDVGLADTGKKKAGQFSLGMRQRLGIAITMLGEPEFLILDEPVNGLDPAGMKEVRELIIKLNKERGMTVLISSHLLEELSKTVTKYGIINQGKLLEEVTVEELDAKCGHQLHIGVDNTQKAISVLSTIIPQNEIITDASNIILHSHVTESARINRMLVEQGVEVSRLEIKADLLEDYFMKRIGD